MQSGITEVICANAIEKGITEHKDERDHASPFILFGMEPKLEGLQY